jgi:hypothetical protein
MIGATGKCRRNCADHAACASSFAIRHGSARS